MQHIFAYEYGWIRNQNASVFLKNTAEEDVVFVFWIRYILDCDIDCDISISAFYMLYLHNDNIVGSIVSYDLICLFVSFLLLHYCTHL